MQQVRPTEVLIGTALLLIAIGVVLLYYGCKVYGQPDPFDAIMSWHKTVAGLNETPERFYAQVFQALKEGLERYEIPLTGFGFGPSHLFKTHSIFAERPLYLQVRYEHLTYYLYCGHGPNGFFVSTWMYSPFVGTDNHLAPTQVTFRRFGKQTMFQHDATMMFIESVHPIVLGVLERYLAEQNLKPLEEMEKRPVMHAFYNPRFYETATMAAVTGKSGKLPRGRMLPF